MEIVNLASMLLAVVVLGSKTVNSVKEIIIQPALINLIVSLQVVQPVVMVNIGIIMAEVMGNTVEILKTQTPAVNVLIIRINQVLLIHSLLAFQKLIAIQVIMLLVKAALGALRMIGRAAIVLMEHFQIVQINHIVMIIKTVILVNTCLLVVMI